MMKPPMKHTTKPGLTRKVNTFVAGASIVLGLIGIAILLILVVATVLEIIF